MNISSGLLKGMPIASLEGNLVRPTKSSVREALFNILGQDLHGLSFLDLCAGTGVMGIEALSRGVGVCGFVEADRRVYKTLSQNVNHALHRLENLLEEGSDLPKTYVKMENYQAFLKRGYAFDILFFDPPHADYEEKSWRLAGFSGCLKEEGTLVLEHARYYPKELPQELDGLKLIKTRKYGQSLLSFYQHG